MLQSYQRLIIFLEFLENRATALEAVGQSDKKAHDKSYHHISLGNDREKCLYCKESGHKTYLCKKFRSLNVNERISFSDRNKICKLCLNSHLGKCKMQLKCHTCSKNHNTLLHADSGKGTQFNQINTVNTSVNTLNESNKSYNKTGNVLLPTIKLKIKTKNNSFLVVRCLLDSGSQMSLISSCLAKELQLKSF